MKILTFLLTFFTTVLDYHQAPHWKLMDDYTVKFTGKKVNGTFRGLKATIFFDENNLAGSKISASITAGSIETGIRLRDKHAKSETALNAEKSPEITFESSRIVKTGTTFEAIGKLTIREVSKEIKLPFSFERSGTTGVFKGKFSLAPKEYHITRGGTPDTIEVELIVPVTN